MSNKFREITKDEIGAMWLYHEEYANKRLGAIAFWKGLSDSQKSNVRRMVNEIIYAYSQENKS